jgi:beta-glucosidase
MPRTGRDRTPADISEREVREFALPAFRAAVRAGARAVMVNSGEIDGEPVHASGHWLTDVLRGELGFDGVIVTDWQDIGFLHTRHHVAPTMKDAVRRAIEAGVDMSMTPYDFEFADILDTLVKDGTIPEHRIDESVRRILALKAAVGLLDERPTYGQEPLVVDLGAHASRHLALDAAREAITLLKNDHVLPLRSDGRLFVTGPGARSTTALHGGWSYTWQGADASHYPPHSPTLLDAIRKRVPHAVYVPGSGFTQGTDADVATAQRAARAADAAIVVLGEDAYAEWIGDISDLTLPEPQLRLARAVAATGTPTVVVLLEGRPRIIAAIAQAAKGIVLGYWPGMEGAEALAEVLFGETNPSGRLPFTYPRAPNALLTYDHRYTETLNTGFTREAGGFDPQFDFGHGLSYTTFAYHDLVVDRETVSPEGTIGVRVTVANTGSRSGAESVLLFSRQHYATLTPSTRRLRAFQRIDLAAGESRTVHFSLPAADLSYVGRDGRAVLEPGLFDLMVGGLTVTLRIAPPPSPSPSP